MIITNKKKFWFLTAYVICAVAGAGLNVWVGFFVSPFNFLAAALCLFFAVWIGSDIHEYVEFPPKEKHPLL